MKFVFLLNMIAALCLGLPTEVIAADPTPKKDAPATAAADSNKAATPAAPAKTRPIPMYSRVDSIDLTNKTFTTKRKKDGVEIKHVLPATAEVRNNKGPAKFGEIKVGDWVAGSRIKKSETEYEIVRITKFGPRAAKGE